MPATAADPATTAADHVPAPPLVALVGWLLPGAGYWMIGQRVRAVTVGVTILTLFFSGILLGGVRAIQVPGYGEDGGRLYLVTERQKVGEDKVLVTERVKEHEPGEGQPQGLWVVRSFKTLLREIGNKPWSICQVMAGPTALVTGAWSISASRPQLSDGTVITPARGVLSHGRINEIAVLYTAVAGMLNLLTMIDAAGRADQALAQMSGRHSRLVGALNFLFRRGGNTRGGNSSLARGR